MAEAFEAGQQFSSLTECINAIEMRFPSDRRLEIERRTPSGDTEVHCVPRYLYRGECDLYPKTESSLTRLQHSGKFDAVEQHCLQRIHEGLSWRFKQKDYANPEWEAEGLLQHYGLPSEIIDFSSSLQVAAAFATSRLSHRGRICVLEWPIGPDTLPVDYTNHPWAKRARRQKAFGIRQFRITDLKSTEAQTELGVFWAEFPLHASDVEGLQAFFESLIDEWTDPTSGILRKEMNHYVEESGKIQHTVAEYLVDRIPMVPCFLWVERVDESTSEASVLHVAPPFRFSNTFEREMTLRYWSKKHPDSTRSFYPFDSPKDPGAIYAYPGTYHPEKVS
jgi:hypothetical protein